MLHAVIATLVLAAAPAAKAPAKKAAPTPPPAQAAAPAGAPVAHFSNAPSILHITSEKWMTMVMVDGTPLQQGDCSSPKACDVSEIAPGPHELDIRGGALGNKPIFKGLVTITGGSEMWGKAKENSFNIYNTQVRAGVVADEGVAVAQPASGTTTTQTTTTVVNGAGPAGPGGVAMGVHFTDPDTGEQVNMDVSAGVMGGGMATTQSTSTTTVTQSTTTVNGASAAPATGKAGVIELTSQDGESFTVFLDGKKAGTFNGLEGQSIKVKNVTAGEHKLVIKDFMEHETWTTGRVTMESGFLLKLGVDEKAGVEAFNRQAAWRPGF